MAIEIKMSSEFNMDDLELSEDFPINLTREHFQSDIPEEIMTKLTPDQRDLALTYERGEKVRKWLVDQAKGTKKHIKKLYAQSDSLSRRLQPLEEISVQGKFGWKILLVLCSFIAFLVWVIFQLWKK